MAKLAEILPHLTIDELQWRFRDCDDAVEKIHWQAIWLRAQGRGTNEVAEICGYNRDWVHQLMRRVSPQLAWVYVYGFVHPSAGRVEWLLLPTVNTELEQLALDFFAEATGASEDRHIILVIDQAGWHMCKGLRIPVGIHLFPLPAYSPELQPSERLWPLLRKAVANKDITDMDQLEDALVARARQLRANPELIHEHTLFGWWARAAEAERLFA